MADALWVVVLVAVCIGMLVAAHYIEPHWVSKDGTTFTCRVQPASVDGRSGGRWVEARAKLVDDRILLSRRGFLGSRSIAGDARAVVGRATGGPARFAIYLLDAGTGSTGADAPAPPAGTRGGQPGGLLALRVPAGSPVTARLDALLP